jgi:hypothetical protein
MLCTGHLLRSDCKEQVERNPELSQSKLRTFNAVLVIDRSSQLPVLRWASWARERTLDLERKPVNMARPAYQLNMYPETQTRLQRTKCLQDEAHLRISLADSVLAQ